LIKFIIKKVNKTFLNKKKDNLTFERLKFKGQHSIFVNKLVEL